MKTKNLPSREFLRKVLDYNPETGLLTWKFRSLDTFASERGGNMWNARFPGKPAFSNDKGRGYLSGWLNEKNYYAHRIAWKWMTDEDPDEIDHENGVRSDNRWSNLRAVTTSENVKNKKRYENNTSGVPGVVWVSSEKKWLSRISVAGKRRHLGWFGDFASAVIARQNAELEHGYHANHGR